MSINSPSPQTFAISVFTCTHHPLPTTIPVVVFFSVAEPFHCARMLTEGCFLLLSSVCVAFCLPCTGSVGIAQAQIKDNNKRTIVFLSNLHSGMWLPQFSRHAKRLIFLVCAMFTVWLKRRLHLCRNIVYQLLLVAGLTLDNSPTQ